MEICSGRFLTAGPKWYLMRISFQNPRIEYVTVTPEGFRYRGQIFPTVNGLFRWFKDHYQDPVPGELRSLTSGLWLEGYLGSESGHH